MPDYGKMMKLYDTIFEEHTKLMANMNKFEHFDEEWAASLDMQVSATEANSSRTLEAIEQLGKVSAEIINKHADRLTRLEEITVRTRATLSKCADAVLVGSDIVSLQKEVSIHKTQLDKLCARRDIPPVQTPPRKSHKKGR